MTVEKKASLIALAILGVIIGLFSYFLFPQILEADRQIDQQKYECRISGGTMENLGRHGFVCIKPNSNR